MSETNGNKVTNTFNQCYIQPHAWHAGVGNNVNAGDSEIHSSSYDTPCDGNRWKPSKSKIKKEVECLKKTLLDKAAKQCTLEDSPIPKNCDRHAGYVQLQMAQYKEHKESHPSGTRKEMMNLTKNSTSDILQPKEFFVKSEELVKNLAKYQNALNDETKKDLLDQLFNVVGVIGEAGVGKSTLVKVLLSQIVGEKKLYNSDFVFFAKLRDFYNNPKLNLFEFLMGKEACESIEWMKDEEIRKAVIEHLAEMDSVCILLDGLDEATIDTKTPMNDVSIYGTELPEKFILGILSGKIFSKAKKIITSRQGQMLDLPDVYKPKFIVKIFGITQEGFQEISQNLCGDRAAEVANKIKNQPDLYSYVMVPIHCILMINCIYECLINSKPLPSNITDVFVLSYFFFTKAKNVDNKPNEMDIQDVNNLQKICSLAWSKMQKRKYNFSDEDLKDADLTPRAVSSFAVTTKRFKKDNPVRIIERATENCTYFSHLLFQEFFAALYCLSFMSNETFHSTFFTSKQIGCTRKKSLSRKRIPGVKKENLTSNHLTMVTKFLFGLSNSETFKTLSENFKISQQKTHVALLKDFLKHEASILKDSDDNYFKDVLRVCSWAHEYHNQRLVQHISDSLPDCLKMTFDIHPNDVLSFHYVIKARSKKLCLDIGANFIGDASLMFAEEMRTILASPLDIEVSIEYKEDVNDEKVKHITNLIVDGVKKIILKNCDLTVSQINLITSRISKLTNSVKLDLSRNKNMEVDGFKHLSMCLHNVSDVDLQYCDIKSEEIKVLSQEITKLKCQIILDLSGSTDMKPEGFRNLSKCLLNVCDLRLCDCDIKSEEIKVLSYTISSLRHPIILDLSRNTNMKPEGFKHLSKFLHNVCDLRLRDCDIKSEEIKVLSHEILKLLDPIQSLDVCGNKLSKKEKEKFKRKWLKKVSKLII